jgi:hypothetical protein
MNCTMTRISMTLALLMLAISQASAQAEQQVDLVPLAEEFGVGYVEGMYFPDWADTSYYKADGESRAAYGGYFQEVAPPASGGHAWMRAWALYDVSAFSASFQVKELLIGSYIYPCDDNEQKTYYRRLSLDPRENEAQTCMDALDGLIYGLGGSIPDTASEVATPLNSSAIADFEEAVNGSGLFKIGITGFDEWVSWGYSDVYIDGWSVGRPILTVVYEDPGTPVRSMTWGMLKVRY